eukprot:gene4726-1802_t
MRGEAYSGYTTRAEQHFARALAAIEYGKGAQSENVKATTTEMAHRSTKKALEMAVEAERARQQSGATIKAERIQRWEYTRDKALKAIQKAVKNRTRGWWEQIMVNYLKSIRGETLEEEPADIAEWRQQWITRCQREGWKIKRHQKKPQLTEWLTSLENEQGTLPAHITEYMEWSYAEKESDISTTQQFQPPTHLDLAPSHPEDQRTRQIEKLVSHVAYKTHRLPYPIDMADTEQRYRTRWTEDRHKWLTSRYTSMATWMANAKEVVRTKEETWGLSPEMEILLTEVL